MQWQCPHQSKVSVGHLQTEIQSFILATCFCKGKARQLRENTLQALNLLLYLNAPPMEMGAQPSCAIFFFLRFLPDLTQPLFMRLHPVQVHGAELLP